MSYILSHIFKRRFKIFKNHENADIYALNDIGQEKLIFALELLAEKESGIYLKNKGLSFDKRIKEINEYIKKAK